MNFLSRLLKTPSGFLTDPKGYRFNQLGHAYLVGGGLAYLLPPFLGALTLFVILTGYVIWELVQWKWFNAPAWDNFEDTAHVMIVACAVYYQLWWLVAIQLMFMHSGYLRRKAGV